MPRPRALLLPLLLGAVLPTLTDCAPRKCANADTPEECAEAGPPGGSSDRVCVWAEYYAVSTDPTCDAQPVREGCVEVALNDGGCGPCHVNSAGDEVVILSEAVNCNGLPGDYASCLPDEPDAACDCACGGS